MPVIGSYAPTALNMVEMDADCAEMYAFKCKHYQKDMLAIMKKDCCIIAKEATANDGQNSISLG